jgi:ketosteroid isomerase-like protein
MGDIIRELQKEFDEAELHADAETLRRLIADDFLSIGPKGFVLDKAGWIGRHVHFEYHAVDTSEMDIRVYDKAAIVRNIQRNRATYKGEEMDLAMRVGQVWVEQGGDWRLAAIQFSPLADG